MPLEKVSHENIRAGATNNANDSIRAAADNPFDLSSICGQPSRLKPCARRFRATIRDDTTAKAMADDHR
jgi:hypothetical protein